MPSYLLFQNASFLLYNDCVYCNSTGQFLWTLKMTCQGNQQMQNGYNVLVMYSQRKDPSQYKVNRSFTDTSSLHQFSLSLRKALAFYVKSICLTGKLSMAPFSVQFFVLLTIIRFKFLFNLYKSSFWQTNAKFLSVCQYRQIH